ncbi:hypothetical protein [Naasia lichenicola]|uniref:Uncharacterized protein n=1 Tax=Naasia lichenicola TaxID=2565933 RepID=A0A4S4FRA1_9MICO|nr:hypothetical protein [Naasia lichenicola]THG32894.1 hypothetical protein E6C64_00510 [Naasia lichenicola]
MPDLTDAAEMARVDPALFARVAASYSGDHDLSDALWWRMHPFEPGPSGAVSPRAQMRDLQEAAYSAVSDEAIRDSALARLAELESEVSTEDAQLTDALRRAIEDRPEQSHPDATHDADTPPSAAGRAAAGVRALALPVLLAALVGAVVTAAVLQTAAPPAELAAGSTPPTSAPARNAALDRLLDDQADGDRPQGVIATGMFLSGIELSSVRKLDVSSADPDVAADAGAAAVYIARDVDDLICLEAQRLDGQLVEGCAKRSVVEDSGLRITWSVADPLGDAAGSSFSLVSVELRPDGTITTTQARSSASSTPTADDELAASYDGHVAAYECFVHAGYTLSTPPTFAEYAAQEAGTRWSPWSEVVPGYALERAVANCDIPAG